MEKETIALAPLCALATGCKSTQQAVDADPLASEPLSQFMQFHPDSKKFLDYQCLDQLLKTSVLDIGRSDRSKLDKPDKSNFTRLDVNQNNASAFEGNRFYFESYTKNSSIRSR